MKRQFTCIHAKWRISQSVAKTTQAFLPSNQCAHATLNHLARRSLAAFQLSCCGSTRTQRRAIPNCIVHFLCGEAFGVVRRMWLGTSSCLCSHVIVCKAAVCVAAAATCRSTGRIVIQESSTWLVQRYKKTPDGGIVSLGVFHGQDCLPWSLASQPFVGLVCAASNLNNLAHRCSAHRMHVSRSKINVSTEKLALAVDASTAYSDLAFRNRTGLS